MSDLDDELTRTLRQHADNLPAAPLAFDDVRGRATSIRRRRRLATGLGVAAAVAVIVPTAMFATRGTSSDGQLPPATAPSTATDTTSPSPSPTSTPTMGSNPHAIDVTDLPTGAPPAAPVLGDNDIALAQTSEAVVRWTKDGTITVEAAGQTFGPYTTSHGMVRNPAATAVAWATDGGRGDGLGRRRGGTVRAERDRTRRRTRRRGHGHRLLPAGGPSARSSSRATTSTPTPARSSPSPSTGVRGEVDPDGLLLSVRDATDDGRVLGLHRDRRARPVHVLCRARPGRDGLEAVVEDLRPRSRHLLAERRATCWPATPTGTASAPASSRCTTPRPASCWPTGRTAARAWRSTTAPSGRTRPTSCSPRYQDGQWSMVRMNVDGAMEYAIAPQKGNQDNVPWRFETR